MILLKPNHSTSYDMDLHVPPTKVFCPLVIAYSGVFLESTKQKYYFFTLKKPILPYM